jgi:hypothetical protein
MKPFLPLTLIILTVFLTACFANVPISRVPADNNSTFQVDFLFEHEGVEVYRFTDRGNNVYFTKPTGEVTSIRNDSTRARVTTHSAR